MYDSIYFAAGKHFKNVLLSSGHIVLPGSGIFYVRKALVH